MTARITFTRTRTIGQIIGHIGENGPTLIQLCPATSEEFLHKFTVIEWRTQGGSVYITNLPHPLSHTQRRLK